MRKKIYPIFLALALLLASMTTAFAAGSALEIEVNYPAAGAKLTAYYVASADGALSAEFANAGVDLTKVTTAAESKAAAGTLAAYAVEHNCTKQPLSEDYRLVGVPSGVYLIVEERGAGNYTAMAPILVVLNVESVKVDPKVSPVGGGGGNSHTSVQVTKRWQDNNDADGLRPVSVTINLLKDGVVVQTVTLRESMNWKYTFRGLDTGHKYTVEEVSVEGYESTITGSASSGYIITNRHETQKPHPEEHTLKVVKVWQGGDQSTRPGSITVELVQDGEVIATVVLNEQNGWEATFGGLDPDKSYSVREIAVEGYIASYSQIENGFQIVNTVKEEVPPPVDQPGNPPSTDTEKPQNPDVPKLPQTGQLQWPAAAMAVLGVMLLMAGGVISWRARKKQ